MNIELINLLEGMKRDTASDCTFYLSSKQLQQIRDWYSKYGGEDHTSNKDVIDLLYELYIREDIDSRPVEDYQRLVFSLADVYHFDKNQFLAMYIHFKEMLFGSMS